MAQDYAIIIARNISFEPINHIVATVLPCEPVTFQTYDTVDSDECTGKRSHHPVELLNTLTTVSLLSDDYHKSSTP